MYSNTWDQCKAAFRDLLQIFSTFSLSVSRKKIEIKKGED